MLATSSSHQVQENRPAGFLADRPRLTRCLDRTDAKIVALVAPAGYGKTTLLAQWAQLDERPVAWIGLRDTGGEPAAILRSVAERVAALDAPEAGAPMIVVLDDVQLAQSDSAGQILQLIAEDLPDGSVLAISSRVEPPLPMGRLRLERRLKELRGADLAMTSEEAREAMRRSGIELDASELSTVMRQTEGWPAALTLAALVLGDDGDRPAATRFAGADRLVADYLREEFTSQLSAAELMLLTQTSMLDQLTGGVCDALCTRRGSGQILRELSRSNTLVTAMDRCEETFRLHPLLRDHLLGELDRAHPERKTELHARASVWFEQHQQTGRAIEHAAASGDAERTGRLLWAVAPIYAGRGRTDAIARPLRRFSHAQLVAEPALALCMAVSHVSHGGRDIVEQWTDTAERALHAHSPARSDLEAGVAVLRAYVARDGVAASGAHARRADRLDQPEGPWRSLASYFQGAALHLVGELDRARTHLEEGLRRAARDGPVVRTLCSAQLALLDLTQERWADGAVHAARARATIVQADLGGVPPIVLGYAVSAFSQAHLGEPTLARLDLAAAERLLNDSEGLTPWYVAEVRVALARTHLRLSDAAAARDELTDAGRALRDSPDADLLRSWIDDAWARSDSFAAGAVAGVSTLTTAELRVLRMLPSHLSLREIAERLHVSANTVKTQAHAVYRKLDASSRSQAVARARSVGLVDG